MTSSGVHAQIYMPRRCIQSNYSATYNASVYINDEARGVFQIDLSQTSVTFKQFVWNGTLLNNGAYMYIYYREY